MAESRMGLDLAANKAFALIEADGAALSGGIQMKSLRALHLDEVE